MRQSFYYLGEVPVKVAISANESGKLPIAWLDLKDLIGSSLACGLSSKRARFLIFTLSFCPPFSLSTDVIAM